MAFLRKYSPFTPTFLQDVSLFLIKKTVSNVFSVQNTLHCFPRPAHDPPATSSLKSGGLWPLNPQDWRLWL